jgi:Peptidase family M1 domain
MIRATFRYLFLVVILSGGLAITQAQNSDGAYQQLRNIALGSEAITVNNATLKRDAATFQLNSGTLCFLSPVLGKVTGAVFVGEGRLLLTPPLPSEQRSLSLLTKEKEFSENFNQLVLRFTDGTYDELKKAGSAASSACDPGLLRDSQAAARKKLHYNLEARVVQDVHSPQPGGLFVAFVHGKKYDNKILFVIDPHGAPEVEPEEIELMTYDENKEGIWTAFHYSDEYAKGTAKSSQKNGVIHIEHQQLDTEIQKSGQLNGKAVTTFVAISPGVRVVPFLLFPSLRVASVTGDGGQGLNFIQENKLEDPQFWVVLPKPLAAGEKYTITTTYGGKEAVINEGEGNYFPVAREDWYPNSAYGAFGEYTSYDITFRVPKGMKMAATGNLVSDTTEGDHNVTVWKSEVPLTVAGFNFGKFKREEAKLDNPDMLIQSYANEEPPDWVRSLRSSANSEFVQGMDDPKGGITAGALGNMSTVVLNKKALAEAQLSVRIYADFFGPTSYKRLQVTQQTATNFGQSWPGLVYLPITYLFDTTTRHQLGNMMRTRYPTYEDDPHGYFSVVAPHEVAHQWWGHTVGFNSYRDQWMSEGFADMSASIYLQFVYAKEPQKYVNFWNDERTLLLKRNSKGFRPIDAGPVTMGYRVANSREGFDTYRNLIYPKGAYILHMVRQMMWDRQNGDQRFKDTMRDFVATYNGSAATTEDFKAIVEKHMATGMDIDKNHKMDWFFDEYVYGTALPSYNFSASFGKAASGGATISFKLTQSGVDKDFAMLVPIYLDLGNGKIARLGSVPISGNNTAEQTVTLTGLKEPPKRAMINYYDDVLASPN